MNAKVWQGLNIKIYDLFNPALHDLITKFSNELGLTNEEADFNKGFCREYAQDQ